MRVVNRTDFMNLPDNTVFCKYRSCCMDDIKIKTGNCGADFVCVDMKTPIGNEGEDSIDAYFRLDGGESVPLDMEATGRDGFFDNNQLFIVFDKVDIKAMISALQECVK